MTTRELIRELVRRIEYATYNQHGYQCERVRRGLAVTRPEACTCGLDALLAEARALIGDTATPSDYVPKEPPAFRRPRPR
jgi:hypothetical protein